MEFVRSRDSSRIVETDVDVVAWNAAYSSPELRMTQLLLRCRPTIAPQIAQEPAPGRDTRTTRDRLRLMVLPVLGWNVCPDPLVR
jgi:hypothetical protein